VVVQYRCIYGEWKTWAERWFPWGGLDYRTESYWYVPGTCPVD
jgi:hypothetical protein